MQYSMFCIHIENVYSNKERYFYMCLNMHIQIKYVLQPGIPGQNSSDNMYVRTKTAFSFRANTYCKPRKYIYKQISFSNSYHNTIS